MNDEQLQSMMPAVNAYLGTQATSSMPGPDPLAGGFSQAPLPSGAFSPAPPPQMSAAPAASFQPPPGPQMSIQPAADPYLGGFSAPPAPPASMPNASFQPPPGPPPAATVPPAPPQTHIYPGRVAPAHEVMNVGPTALHYYNQQEQTELQGLKDATEAQKTGYLNQAIAAQNARDEAEAKIRGAEQAMAIHQKRQDEGRARIDAAINEPGPGKITDYWSDRSTGQHVATALAAGLASLGMAISRQSGPNPVMQMLEHNIDADLKTKQLNFQAQQSGKQQKIDAAQQQFNNLAKDVGLDSAKDTWAAMLHQKANAELAMNAATAKIPEADANLAKLQADIQAKFDERRASAFIKFVPATSGGPQFSHPDFPEVPITRKEYLEYVQKKALEGQQQSGKLELEGVKGQHTKANEGPKFIAEKLQAANVPRTLSAIQDAQKDYAQGPGGEAADTSGIGIMGRAVRSTPVIGALAYRTLYGENAAEREQNWGILKGEILKSLEGRISPQLYEKQQQILDGTNTPDARRHILETMAKQLGAQSNVIKAGAGPEGAAAFEQNLQDLTPPTIDVRPVK